MFASRTGWNTTPNRLSQRLEERRRAGDPVIDLTVSNPTTCNFSFKERAILTALADPAALRYEPNPRGLAQARQAVQDYYAGQGTSVSPEQLLLTTGTSEAYSHLFRLLANPGEEVLSPAPSYPLFDFLADVNDVRLKPYPLRYESGWRIDFDGLQSAITPRTRAIIVVTPNNPTGSVLHRDELEFLIDLARKHGLAIIADEVFADYLWQADEEYAGSLAREEACLTFTLNGLSKIAALPQMKLGWIVANGPTARRDEALARLEVIADTYLSVGAPVQIAARALLETRSSMQQQIMERIGANLDALDEQLKGEKPCSRLCAEGGWYAVLRVPSTKTDEEWALELLEKKGVYVHPGQFFDFPGDGYLVLSLITPEKEFARGIERILERITG
jgi:aspartate/methionine/tyrosine aminotransferase